MKGCWFLVCRGSKLFPHHPANSAHYNLFDLRFVATRLLVINL